MNELGPDEQRWLDVLRAADRPTDADRSRVRNAVLASVVGVAAGGAGAGAAAGAAGGLGKAAVGAKTASIAGSLLVPWKIGVAVVSLVVAGSVASVMFRRGPEATTSDSSTAKVATMTDTDSRARAGAVGPNGTGGDVPSTTSAPAAESVHSASPANAGSEAKVDEPSVATAQSNEDVSTAAKAPRDAVQTHGSSGVRRTSPHPAQSSTAPDDVDAELQLLTDAQQALKRGDPSAALQTLARHRREHPRGALAVEREGLRAVATCEAKRDGGVSLAERFIAKNPQSPLVTRVRAACLSP